MTASGVAHAMLAMVGIVVGFAQFVRPKGTRVHRALGYAYVYAMLVADGLALLIYQFTGKFNILHIGAIANLTFIMVAIIPVLRTPRPSNWKRLHYYWMGWSYVGLMAAGATQLVVQTGQLATRGQAWTAIAVVSVVVTVIGFFLIGRYRPVSESQSDLGEAMSRHGGAQS